MHKQTKESFEKFLEECRQEAKPLQDGESILLPGIIDCPWCKGSSYLEDEQYGHVIGKDAWRGTKYYYHCDNCKENYTTTESDTISLASLKLIEQPNNNP